MSNRMKEEERIERIIRSLLKLQENRRCINCNSLGPQYVCTTFWTFVCTSCSGVHREFTHRIKSVSMARFNAEEVSALQAGGNERARQIYFKEWDPQRHSFPDGSNQNRLRDFIKHVYVDRKFTGERSMGRLAMVKGGAREDSSDRHSIEKPSPGGRTDERSLKYYMERSPRYKRNNVRSSGHRNRPVNFEIVDDRFRDDGFGSGRRSSSNRPSNAKSRAGSRSPVSQKSREKISPPVVHSVRDILGENIPSRQVAESPKANDRRDNVGSARGQNTTSSTDPGSVDGKSLENKRVTSGSLIDFSPELPDHAAATQMQQTALLMNGGTGASVQSSTKVKVSDDPTVNSLESILFELSVPAAGPVDIMSAAQGNVDALSAVPVALSNSVGAVVATSTTNTPGALSTGDAPAASPVRVAPILPSSSSDSMIKVMGGQQLPIMQSNRPCSFPSGDSSSTTQHTAPSVGAFYSQSWTSSLAPNAQGSSSASAKELSQAISKVAQDNTSGVGLQAFQVEAKFSGRKELPVDLFTSSYSPFPAPVPSWQICPPHGMGYNMQYHPNAVPVPVFPNSAKSRNPFDLDDDSTQAQVSMFPPMLPWQGSLPNSSAPMASLCSCDTHSSQLMQPQTLPYASIVSSLFPSHGTSLSPRAYIGRQLPNNMPFSGPQGISCFSGGEAAFASSNPIQQPSSRFPAPTTSNPFSSTGGNPFG